MAGQIEIPLFEKSDSNKDKYLIGDAGDIPGSLRLDDCTFIIFFPEEGESGKIIKPGKLVIRKKKSVSKPEHTPEDS